MALLRVPKMSSSLCVTRSVHEVFDFDFTEPEVKMCFAVTACVFGLASGVDRQICAWWLKRMAPSAQRKKSSCESSCELRS